MVHLEALYHKYKDQAQFCLVYISEAHPGERRFVDLVPEPMKDLAKKSKLPDNRQARAELLRKLFQTTIPVYLDSEDADVEINYRVQLAGLTVIDADGFILYSGNLTDLLKGFDAEEGALSRFFQQQFPTPAG